jgi:hypothetical protein
MLHSLQTRPAPSIHLLCRLSTCTFPLAITWKPLVLFAPSSVSHHIALIAMSGPSPPFTALPLRRPGPPLNAWGLYGDDDELGRLNLITNEAVQRGLAAATSGRVINLK